jgi:hypothetical protein
MKIIIVVFSFVFIVLDLSAQCISQDKITSGGDWSNYDYTYFCPAYNFAYNGNKDKEWSTVSDPIDINLVGKQIFPLKKKIESIIKRFAGEEFYSKIKFCSVDIVYLDSLEKFEDRMPSCNMNKCKAKYFFNYLFSPVEGARYNIGIAVNKDWKIVSKFNFPSKKDYQVVDTSLTICKIVKIAESFKSRILPIKSIRLDFEPNENKFYWVVEQEATNEKDGLNNYYDLYIDAFNYRKTKFVKRVVYTESYEGVEIIDI